MDQSREVFFKIEGKYNMCYYYLNSKQKMSQPQKIQFPPPQYRFPIPYPPLNPQKFKNPSPILGSNPAPNLLSNPNMAGMPFMPPRIPYPYMPGYNMPLLPHMPPFGPYMPINRNPQIPLQQGQNSKTQKQTQERPMPPRMFFNRPMGPYYNPGMFFSPPQYPIPDQQLSKLQSKTQPVTQSEQKFQSKSIPQAIKQIKPQHSSSSQTPIIRQTQRQRQELKQKQKQAKQMKEIKEIKEVRHSDIKHYEPEPPKKKRKLQTPMIENSSTREMREKKQSIQRVMAMVMKEKPLRDRVIKIGKEHQAFIPESFINEYEYNLKIKLQKKKSLMSRLVTTF